jgi:hypothetical protein
MLSPTNAILTGLAVADMLVMTSYLPYSIHNFIRHGLTEEEKYSNGWAIFTLIHAHSSIVCHTISIWLTVILAVWRYVAVRYIYRYIYIYLFRKHSECQLNETNLRFCHYHSYPTDSKILCSMSRAKYAISFTYVSCLILCVPAYLTFTINMSENDNIYTYKVCVKLTFDLKVVESTSELKVNLKKHWVRLPLTLFIRAKWFSNRKKINFIQYFTCAHIK